MASAFNSDTEHLKHEALVCKQSQYLFDGLSHLQCPSISTWRGSRDIQHLLMLAGPTEPTHGPRGHINMPIFLSLIVDLGEKTSMSIASFRSLALTPSDDMLSSVIKLNPVLQKTVVSLGVVGDLRTKVVRLLPRYL